MIFYFILTLANMVFQPLYLIFAYLSYLPAKLILQQNTEALVNYSNMLSFKADTHSITAAQFVNTVLSYIFSAFIWTAALALTPGMQAYDAVRSKFSDVEEPDEPSNRIGKQVV
ncbi:MAG: hypothetical protein PG981_000391 [Wolbachia endosymbiont of Ctenocephalides orientis wCori]|nr:MAG: hypothetical protein PG981_000391 [Wolbachia endosymbiont of Ctenocephalides orientis wCori]